MMRSTQCILYIFLCLFAFLPCTGQTTFAFRYLNGYRGNMVHQMANGDFVIAGGEDGYSHDRYEVWSGADWKRNADMFMMRTDAQGAVLWQKGIGRLNSRDHARWMEPTTDGGFILLGSTTFEMSVASPPGGSMLDSSNIALVKTDADGNVQWAKRYDSGKDDWGWSVVQTADGGYMVSAFVDLVPVSLIGNTRAWLIKMDNLGNVQWEGKYQFAIRDFDTGKPFIYVTKQTMNKGYVIVGSTFSSHQADLYVMRLDSVGVVQWAKSYDAALPNLSGAYDVLEAPDSSFIITGFMDKNRAMMQTNYPYVIRVSKTGAVMKTVLFDYNSFRTRTGFSAVRPAPGGYIFTGSAGYGESGEELVLVKTDTALNLIWGRHYDFGGPMMGGSRHAMPTADLGYVMAGQFSMNGLSLLRMDSLGMIMCNVPTPVITSTPMVNVVNWNPDTLCGITVAAWAPIVTAMAEVNTVSCPLNVPLPAATLNLSLLAVRDDWVKLGWSNEAIPNPSEIHLECDRDDNGFQVISSMTNASIQTGEFQTLETALETQNSHAYRLKVIDQDGGILHSNVVWVNPAKHYSATVLAFQQLSNLKVKVMDIHGGPWNWAVRDMAGRTLKEGSLAAEQNGILSIDLSTLASGVYLLNLKGPGHEVWVKKFVWKSN